MVGQTLADRLQLRVPLVFASAFHSFGRRKKTVRSRWQVMPGQDCRMRPFCAMRARQSTLNVKVRGSTRESRCLGSGSDAGSPPTRNIPSPAPPYQGMPQTRSTCTSFPGLTVPFLESPAPPYRVACLTAVRLGSYSHVQGPLSPWPRASCSLASRATLEPLPASRSCLIPAPTCPQPRLWAEYAP